MGHSSFAKRFIGNALSGWKWFALKPAMLNPTLQAALDHHIGQSQVLFLVANVLSVDQPLHYLEYSKFLQIILNNSQNPLLSSRDDPDQSHLLLAFIILRLFSANKSQATLTTIHQVFLLYRGSNDIIDAALSSIIRSYGDGQMNALEEIKSFAFAADSGDEAFVKRHHGSLKITFDGVKLTKTISNFPTRNTFATIETHQKVDKFLKDAELYHVGSSLTYDLWFLSAALLHCSWDSENVVDLQTAAEEGIVGFLLMGLSSAHQLTRAMSFAYLERYAIKLKVCYWIPTISCCMI
jgi:hypothetical protein